MDGGEIAFGAARRLSVDVANLSFRQAMLETELDHLKQLALLLTPGAWRRLMQPVPLEGLVHDPDDTGPVETEMAVTLTGEQVVVLDAILSALYDLS